MTVPEKSTPRTPSRFRILDQMRGFFIVVIIIDHLSRWPSFLEVFTGRGTLWVNAAFGFVIISGLLIGYIRGYRDRKKPFLATAKKLLRRAIMLYIWLIIGTVVYAAITWYSPHPELLAWVEIPTGQWWLLITSAATFAYTNNWVHFLSLYALFLLCAPIFVYLLRKKHVWLTVGLSIIAYSIGRLSDIEWLQWQILFFIPAIAGFYLEKIMMFWKRLDSAKKRAITNSIYGLTLVTIITSVFTTRIMPEAAPAMYINTYLSIDPLSIGVVILAFIWFIALILFFSHSEHFIDKWLGWLLYPLGMYSLTAYIIHPVAIIIMAFIFTGSSSILLNTAIGIVCVIATWVLVKQPWVQKAIPH